VAEFSNPSPGESDCELSLKMAAKMDPQMMKVLENRLDFGLSTKANTGDQEYRSYYHIVFENIVLPLK